MLTCQLCGHQWRQTFDPVKRQTEKGEEQKTLAAAAVNKQGQFCELCRHLEMARRYAEARNWITVVEAINVAQAKIPVDKP